MHGKHHSSQQMCPTPVVVSCSATPSQRRITYAVISARSRLHVGAPCWSATTRSVSRSRASFRIVSRKFLPSRSIDPACSKDDMGRTTLCQRPFASQFACAIHAHWHGRIRLHIRDRAGSIEDIVRRKVDYARTDCAGFFADHSHCLSIDGIRQDPVRSPPCPLPYMPRDSRSIAAARIEWLHEHSSELARSICVTPRRNDLSQWRKRLHQLAADLPSATSNKNSPAHLRPHIHIHQYTVSSSSRSRYCP